MAKHEGTFKSHLRVTLNEEKDIRGNLWWGDRPRNRWLFPIAQYCGWSKGMGTNAKQ